MTVGFAAEARSLWERGYLPPDAIGEVAWAHIAMWEREHARALAEDRRKQDLFAKMGA